MSLRRTLLTSAAVFVLGAAGAAGQALPAGYDGAAATGLALRRLGTTARVLHIGAHPDDENTALFAPLALGRGVDAAYLSITRGEGGQNGIGPELGVALGVIRSEELLAARRLDGGTQFFTRAIDYGYSKGADEAFRHWPRDTLLADVVAIIRAYRPDVVASVWSGTPRDGHGQHEASGILAREAVLAAGDPTRFPDQIAAGLRPHTPALYYRSAWFSEGPPDVALNTGELDPLLGSSYHQLAMASRSLHRSQDQGRRLNPGPRNTAFDRVDPADPVDVADERRFGRYGEGEPDRTGSLFEGVDTLLSQRAARVRATGEDNGGAARLDRLVDHLGRYEQRVLAARSGYRALEPAAILSELAGAQEEIESAVGLLGEADEDSDALAQLSFHARAELEDLRAAIVRAANVLVAVEADEALVVPGGTFRVEMSVWNGGPRPVRARAQPRLPAGWTATATRGEAALLVAPGQRSVAAFEVTVPGDARPTMPYFLDPAGPEPVDLYRWPADPAVRGLPFAPAPVRGAFSLEIEGLGHAVPVVHEAVHVGVDARDGEYRMPVKVVPAVAVDLKPAVAVVPVAATGRKLTFSVRLHSRAPEAIQGEIRLDLPDGWGTGAPAVPARIAPGAEQTFTLEVEPPAGLEPGVFEVGARFVAGAASYDVGFDLVDYPHIAPHHLYRTARARVRALDVEVADVRVGYVMGAGDGVPEALDQLGVDWSALDADDLARGDLSRFDVIVTGIRAYEVRDDLPGHNQRLLDWVRGGGTLLVQYNKYEALARDYAPWPATIARPHGRVTDETAPVRVLEPGHPVFTTPNRISARDWSGWVQERGLYFWDTWGDPLTPLLAMADPGEEPLTGSLLVGPLGKGTYVYTGLAFFRQLPEGVPGAYRLLANLLSLGAAR